MYILYKIQTLKAIFDLLQDYTMSIFLRRRWQDRRLDFSDQSPFTLVLLGDQLDNFWVPDIFFPNARDGYFHNITQPLRSIWLDPDGSVYFTSRFVPLNEGKHNALSSIANLPLLGFF